MDPLEFLTCILWRNIQESEKGPFGEQTSFRRKGFTIYIPQKWKVITGCKKNLGEIVK